MQDWEKIDCPINGNLPNEKRIQCDECNKLNCPFDIQENKKIKGMIVDIYKNNENDYSNGGLSSKSNRCLLVGFGIPEIFEAPELPVVKIVNRDLRDSIYLTAYPVKEDGTVDNDCMFGGCFIYSSDSRFYKLATYPVPLHDRKE